MDERYLMFLGDSHTVGAGDENATGWVGRVCATAIAASIPVTPYNLGIRGESSAEVAARWRAEVTLRLPEEGEPRAVIAFGVNDVALREGRQSCSTEQSLDNLDAVLEGARELGMPTFMVGPAAVAEAAETERIAALSAAFAEHCERCRVPYVPLVERLRESETWMREVAAGDGAHPRAGGYEELARLVLAGGWLEWLRS